MTTFIYSVEFEQDSDGRWSATIPDLAGCSTWGHTRDEALEALKEALVAYLTTLAEEGRLPTNLPGIRFFDKAPVLAVDIKLSA